MIVTFCVVVPFLFYIKDHEFQGIKSGSYVAIQMHECICSRIV